MDGGFKAGDTIHQSFDLTTDWADFGQVLTDSSDGMSTFNVTRVTMESLP
jgi:hypothetical protein